MFPEKLKIASEAKLSTPRFWVLLCHLSLSDFETGSCYVIWAGQELCPASASVLRFADMCHHVCPSNVSYLKK